MNQVTDAVATDESGGGGRNRTGVDGFAGRCITTLLPRHAVCRYGCEEKRESLRFPLIFGAAEESRTLDLNLGKVALYQLSYCRKTAADYSQFINRVNIPTRLSHSFAAQ